MRYCWRWIILVCSVFFIGSHIQWNLSKITNLQAVTERNYQKAPASPKNNLKDHQQINEEYITDLRYESNEEISKPDQWSGINNEVKTTKIVPSIPTFSIVTAADSGHFLTLLGAIWGLRRTEDERTLMFVYDLGFKLCQREYLNQISKCLPNLYIRSFNYSQYPPFFDIKDKAGSYGWKPVIIDQVLEERKGQVIWIDAGTELGRRLDIILLDLRSFQTDGFISSVTTGSMQQWTHEGMISWFETYQKNKEEEEEDNQKEDVRNSSINVRQIFNKYKLSSNCNGAFVGFQYDTIARQSIVPLWTKCAYDQSCIAPIGSSRRNHRQDQSALTLLTKLYLNSERGCFPMRAHGSMRFWRDIYYEVNSPIVFGFQCLSEQSRKKPNLRAGLICDTLSTTSTSTSSTTLSSQSIKSSLMLIRLDVRSRKDESKLVKLIAFLRQSLSSLSSSFHVLLVLSTNSPRLQIIETVIGMDSFVSVLFKPTKQTLYQVLQKFDSYYLYPLESLNCEFDQVCIRPPPPWKNNDLIFVQSVRTSPYHQQQQRNTAKNDMCQVIESTFSNIDDFLDMVDEGITPSQSVKNIKTPKHKIEYCEININIKKTVEKEKENNFEEEDKFDEIFDKTLSPILIDEAAVEKDDQKRIRQLKKSLPKKGIVLALFGQTKQERTQLALTSVLMGALGFGLRWKNNELSSLTSSSFNEKTELSKLNYQNKNKIERKGELIMNELEKADIEILKNIDHGNKLFHSSSSSLSSSFEHVNLSSETLSKVEAFTRKSKKEVKHAPWVMTSQSLVNTFHVWKQFLDSYFCIVLSHQGFHDEYVKMVNQSCIGAPIFVINKIDHSELYILYQKLRAHVGNVRALSLSEVEFLSSIV